MSTCPGLHCDGCGPGGGSGIGFAVLVVLAVVLGASAVRSVMPYVRFALEVAEYTLFTAAGITVAAAAVYAGYRVRRARSVRRPRRVPYTVTVTGVTPARPAEDTVRPAPAPIEATRIFPAGWPPPGQAERAARPAGGDRDAW